MSSRFFPSGDSSHAPIWNSVHTAALAVLPGALRLLRVAEPDIDDLSQDVLLAAYESLDRFDPAYPASAGHPPPREAVSAGAPRPSGAARVRKRAVPMSRTRARDGLGAHPARRTVGRRRGASGLARAAFAAAIAAAIGLLWIVEAHAAPAPPEVMMRLEMTRGPGAEACPDEMFVRTEVARRFGADPFQDDAPQVLKVSIGREGPEFTASISLRDPEGETRWADGFGTRSGCEELLSGVALAIVAQIMGVPEPAPRAPEPSPRPPQAPPPPPQAQRPAPEPSRPVERSHDSARPRAAPTERLQLEAGLGAILGLGITPGAAAGMTLSLGVRRSDWSIAVEGRGLVALAQEVEAMPVRIRAFTAAAVACHRSQYLFGCAVTTAGVVRFVPRDPWTISSPSQPMVGFGPRLGSAWPLSDRWSAYAYGEAIWIVADAVLRRQKEGNGSLPALSWSSPPAGAALGFGVTATY
ncbi:hypothetical protein WMF37_39755 [Sorangium sp. So ce291]|uniref:hypothetical protein n=1 Tax=Sorangium sp. So ce291 TaxID=3133294 RepID=UPI003F5F02EE